MLQSKRKKVLRLLCSHHKIAAIHRSQHHAVSKNARRHHFVRLCCPFPLSESVGLIGKPQRKDFWRCSFALKRWETLAITRPKKCRTSKVEKVKSWEQKRDKAKRKKLVWTVLFKRAGVNLGCEHCFLCRFFHNKNVRCALLRIVAKRSLYSPGPVIGPNHPASHK